MKTVVYFKAQLSEGLQSIIVRALENQVKSFVAKGIKSGEATRLLSKQFDLVSYKTISQVVSEFYQ